MKYTKQLLMTALVSTVLFTACKKENDSIIEDPHVHEEELITTVRLVVTNSSGFNKTFNYKVDNGFNSSEPATPAIDEIELEHDTHYDVDVQVWNESESPAENITEEVKEESHHHLFLFESTPAMGAGSIIFEDGNKDDEGLPFNQTISFHTGGQGNGTVTVTLKHEPTDKTATTPAAAGGETDAQAVFPVVLQ